MLGLLIGPKQHAHATSALPQLLLPLLGASQAVLCDSGTSALRIALQSTGRVGAVAMPGFGCFDLATAAIGAGVAVCLYDIDPNTLAPDLDSLESVLQNGASTVVAASLFGYAPPMPAIRALCDRYGAFLIEDIAQGAGASVNDMVLGSWGDAAVLSFGRGKGTGGAGGGAVVFRQPVHADRYPALGVVPSARTGLAALVAQQVLSHPMLFRLPSLLPWLQLGATVYHEPWPPTGITEAQAWLAEQSLEQQARLTAQRRAVASDIFRALKMSGNEEQAIRVLPGAQPGYLRFALHLESEGVEQLWAWGCRRSYPVALSQLPPLLPSITGQPAIPGALEAVRSIATLPTHRHVSPADLKRLEKVLSRPLRLFS
ncbi:hypothetical protein GEMMAAP_03540 [Gemmatimonas phototrophica]|uniref:DegT/DnrJ/EryC1/StrS aminotransferase n=1 Tax=Gemmatimonas phototrophica TaxID=1379270 RepID=A0A143BGH8_9BACT|nr:hypothetical protein GEMMAAP_03540 [Gemmatimonas phototrophica]